MLKVIQITDTHLSEPGQTLWGMDPYKRLEAAFEDIRTFHSDARACIISGDLTDSASPGALLWIKDYLADFPISTYLMIGNHDVRSVFFDVFQTYPKDANGFLQYSFNLAEAQFLCLDTKKDQSGSSGQYCAKRMTWLKNELKKPLRMCTFLCTTHLLTLASHIWIGSSLMKQKTLGIWSLVPRMSNTSSLAMYIDRSF